MKGDPLKISGMHDSASSKVFKNASKLRMQMTEAEIKLWDYLKEKRTGFKFRRQHPISNYILDFYCHKLRLSIELDGKYHLRKEQRLKDVVRKKYLDSVGIHEIRFYNEVVMGDIDFVLNAINNKIEKLARPLGGWGAENAENKNS